MNPCPYCGEPTVLSKCAVCRDALRRALGQSTVDAVRTGLRGPKFHGPEQLFSFLVSCVQEQLQKVRS